MRNKEENIVLETANLYLYKMAKGYEIRLNGATHAVVVCPSPSVEKAAVTMRRLESYIGDLRKWLNHY